MNESAPLLEKAERSLLAAEQLFAAGHLDFAVSRAYYACFYIAEGLLLSRGLEFSRHGQVIAQYDDSMDLPEAEVVLELIREGHRFLEAAKRLLASPPSDLG